MTDISSERRASNRVDFNAVVLVRNAKRQIPCWAVNVSETGILVRPTRQEEPGSQFRVTFPLPGPSWLDVEGRLVHRTRVERRIAWGIEFVGVPAAMRDQLRHLVKCEPAPVPEATLSGPSERSERKTKKVARIELARDPREQDTSRTPLSVLKRLLRSTKK